MKKEKRKIDAPKDCDNLGPRRKYLAADREPGQEDSGEEYSNEFSAPAVFFILAVTVLLFWFGW
jgi:hypothetical protein